jgi:outer membrane protein assembly factor BamB
LRSIYISAALAGLITLTASAGPVFSQKSDGKRDVHWPSYRGANARGVADGFPTPTEWDAEAGKNVRWKTAIPGLGHSSPIIWGNRLFVTTAVSAKGKADLRVGLYGDIAAADDNDVQEWKIYCLDKASGKVLWERTAHKGVPKVKRHTKATHANSTMATDGKRVVAFFGSEGLHCYDMAGKPLWKKDFGVLDSGFFMVPTAQWGFASSPILHSGMVIVQVDVQKDSFVAALDAATGEVKWKTPRADVPTWSTPTVVNSPSGPQVVVNGWKHTGGYDLKTGKEVWKLVGGGDIPVPTPIEAHGLVYITNAHGMMAPIYAIKTSATGDITPKPEETSTPNLPWLARREGAYMQTPIVYGDYLYVCRDHGVLSCYDAKTGKRLYNERLGTGRTGFTSSGVAASGKLYYTSEMGEVFVVQAGPEFKLLATNPLGEVCMSTPAISEGNLYFRTQGHVVAVGGK